MIIVLDSNVWISGIFWSGPPHEIIALAEREVIALATSEDLLSELFGVLAREKFTPYFVATKTDLQTVREQVLSLIHLYPTMETVTAITEDPADNMVLACALAADADCMVSGDDHLLSLKTFRDIPILTPRRFLQRLKNLGLIG